MGLEHGLFGDHPWRDFINYEQTATPAVTEAPAASAPQTESAPAPVEVEVWTPPETHTPETDQGDL